MTHACLSHCPQGDAVYTGHIWVLPLLLDLVHLRSKPRVARSWSRIETYICIAHSRYLTCIGHCMSNGEAFDALLSFGWTFWMCNALHLSLTHLGHSGAKTCVHRSHVCRGGRPAYLFAGMTRLVLLLRLTVHLSFLPCDDPGSRHIFIWFSFKRRALAWHCMRVRWPSIRTRTQIGQASTLKAH
jgi:hypothetical protein